MSRKEEFTERVVRMAQRNGLKTQIVVSTGAFYLFAEDNETAKVLVSMATKPCRVNIQFADGTFQTEQWALLESVCRNMSQGAQG